MTLDPDSFGDFFEALHGYQPFKWQEALARRVIGGSWPEGIDVPTGLGKTALVDIAVFALAAQAAWPPEQRTAPTRTFMVVDRRLVVDQTFSRAEHIADRLQQATGGIEGEVAKALRKLTGGASDAPLEVVRMRGGVTWNWRWVSSPDQPALVVGTVDQFGSRLLFRGYGVAAWLRSIDAALCGADALLILDEAHIARALAQTTDRVHRYEQTAREPVLPLRRPRPVLVSATLPSGTGDIFRPDLSAETSATARARLEAQKLTRLIQVAIRAKDPVPDLARSLSLVAKDLMARDAVQRVAVVCNTVRLARQVFANLLPDSRESQRCLLIGRCRGWDRERNAAEFAPMLGPVTGEPVHPMLAVATQTIEVGADFDFDAMVTEAAPFDALTQRLGRLNRFARTTVADAVAVYCDARHDEDPVYGAATQRTWEWMTERAGSVEPTPPAGVVPSLQDAPSIDLGPLAINQLLRPGQRAGLSTEAAPAPVVLGPTIAAWARTLPAPDPDQPVGPYLHGVGGGAPEVLVCWRAGLFTADAGAWNKELEATPIADAECVSVPLWEAQRFLRGETTGPVADLEGVPTPGGEEPRTDAGTQLQKPSAWMRRPEATQFEPASPERLAPGAFLVVPSEAGGHDRWGWTGTAGEDRVPDVADLCRGWYRIRLRPGLLQFLFGEGDWTKAVTSVAKSEEQSAEVSKLLRSLPEAGPTDDPPGWLGDVAHRVAAQAKDLARSVDAGRARITVIDPDLIMVEDRRLRSARNGPAVFDQEGDDGVASSSVVGAVVGLERHLLDVAGQAAEVAGRLGLPLLLVNSIELAGRSHDLGKFEPRFQVMLHGGNRLRKEAWPEPVAKSGMSPTDRAARSLAARLSGWPRGMRHEAVSGAVLERYLAEFPEVFEGCDPELVAHLVSTHHGRARPLLPPTLDNSPETVHAVLPGSPGPVTAMSDALLMDWTQPERFERLAARYGWWGLALMESILRLADMACSASYERPQR
jgi:CRISPR-associated endonuclease/helicase Cas3